MVAETRSRARLIPLLAIASVTPSLAEHVHAAEIVGPVAVMPLRNLAEDRKLDWLGRGMGATLLLDIERSGKVAVVDRAQLDKAIRGLALARHRDDAADAADAARIGKQVGARRVLVGTYEEAAGQLRIAARWVAVDTGVGEPAVTAAGPVEEVFPLEREILGGLLGVAPATLAPPAPRRAGKRKAPPPPHLLEAYELYARSLDAPGDVERVALLHRALAADPELAYATHDLAPLVRRLAVYRPVDTAKLAEKERARLGRLSDPRSPVDERLRAAHDLLEGMVRDRRYHTLEALEPQLHALGLPPKDAAELDEYASYALFQAEDGLRQTGLALDHGDVHLRTFPGGTHYKLVEERMHDILEQRRKQESRRKEYQSDVAEKRKNLVKDGRVLPGSQLEFDYAPCIAARWNNQVGEVMLDACQKFLDAHAHDTTEDGREHLAAARYFIVLSLAEIGDFDTARPLAARLLTEAVTWREELRVAMATWPVD